MLVALAEALETPVSALLGKTAAEPKSRKRMNASPTAYHIVCGHSNDFCSLDRSEECLLRLGL